jgi:hypothetical protein
MKARKARQNQGFCKFDSSDEEGFLKLQQIGGTGISLGSGKSSASYSVHDLTGLTELLQAWVRRAF